MDGQPALIRVQMPDRPGALGLVASRIGALKADIVAIEILSRVDGAAYDEITVVLPQPELVGVLTREIEEVDGVRVDAVSLIEELPEPRLDALRTAVALVTATSVAELATRLLDAAEHLRADWIGIIDGERVFAVGPVPDTATALEAAASHTVRVGPGALALARERRLSSSEAGRLAALCELATSAWSRLEP
jgi:hypothetical protein